MVNGCVMDFPIMFIQIAYKESRFGMEVVEDTIPFTYAIYLALVSHAALA